MSDCCRRMSFIVSLCAALALAGRADAAGGRVVVLEPEISPPPSDALRDRLHEAAARGAEPAFEAVPAAELRVRMGTMNLSSCRGGACATQLVSAFQAAGYVATQVTQTGKTYTVDVRVFDGTGREVAKKTGERCDICTAKEAGDTVEKAVKQAMVPAAPALRTAAAVEEEGPGGPRPSSRDGASQPAARRTASRATAPVEERPREAREEQPREEQPREAQPEEARREVQPPREEEPPRRDRGPTGFPYRPLAYGAFALAGVSLIAAISFGVYAARESQPSCDLPDPRRSCPEIYSGNAAPAGVFGVLTLLSAGAGGALLFLEWRARRQVPTVLVAPTRDGVAAMATFRF